MISTFIEATDGTEFNYGKFLIARFTPEEYARPATINVGRALLPAIGMNPNDILVVDLQTCEGAIFTPGGLASSDLNKHRVWVCPMFEPFLEWLYRQDLTDLGKLPLMVNLGDVPTSMQGYRRGGGPAQGDKAATVEVQGSSVHYGRDKPLTDLPARPLARDKPLEAPPKQKP